MFRQYPICTAHVQSVPHFYNQYPNVFSPCPAISIFTALVQGLCYQRYEFLSVASPNNYLHINSFDHQCLWSSSEWCYRMMACCSLSLEHPPPPAFPICHVSLILCSHQLGWSWCNCSEHSGNKLVNMYHADPFNMALHFLLFRLSIMLLVWLVHCDNNYHTFSDHEMSNAPIDISFKMSLHH